jgi:hypothetical protein
MKIKQEIDKLIKGNMFGEEDRKLATFMLSLLSKNPKAMKKAKDKDYIRWFKNLKKNGVVTKDYKISVSEDWDKYSGIEFILMMMCAKGYIKKV